MGRYRVDILDDQIVGCSKITKKENLHDYALLTQCKHFAHIDFGSKKIVAFLLYATDSEDAKLKAAEKLQRINSN